MFFNQSSIASVFPALTNAQTFQILALQMHLTNVKKWVHNLFSAKFVIVSPHTILNFDGRVDAVAKARVTRKRGLRFRSH